MLDSTWLSHVLPSHRSHSRADRSPVAKGARRRDDGRVYLRLAAAAADPYRPLMAHLMITRRCNLACGYCYEADRDSPPVAIEVLRERVDHLARLRTVFVTITGGEPLLHPEVVELVRYIRESGMIPVMNSNAFILTEALIEALSDAGLYALQISIDNVEPNETTKKSLRLLQPKLVLLAQRARFHVRINTVLGSGSESQALEVARAAVALGFEAKCSLVRDSHGKVVPPSAEAKEIYEEIVGLGKRASFLLSEDFQETLMDEGECDYKCRAGARYFMICEDGLVHLCESSHQTPGTKLADYSEADIRRNFHLRKSCAKTCAVAYAHQASRLDSWRPQEDTPTEIRKASWLEAKQRQATAQSSLVMPGRGRPS